MSTHHTQKIQEKRLALLKRALDFLIKSELPLSLNNKPQKKITFNPAQTIEAMTHVATIEEIMQGIPLKETSIFYKTDNKYSPLLDTAKEDKLNRLNQLTNYKSDSKNLDILELTTRLQTLNEQKELLQSKVEHLQSVIEQAEIQEDVLDHNHSSSKRFINKELNEDILKNLLISLSKEDLIEIIKKHNSAPYQVFLKSLGERKLIGNLDDIIENTGARIGKNHYEELIFKDENQKKPT